MSHFTVLVIGADVDKQLAPYQEEVAGDSPYAAFEDIEAESLNEYQTKTTEQIQLESGKLVFPFDERFRVIEKNGNPAIGMGSHTHKVPENLKRVQVPFTQIYPTFKRFMDDYHGYKKRDSRTGKYGHWYNPKAKWDWYCVGGRWTGFFKLKPGIEAPIGTVDAARKKDIDFESMRTEAGNKARTKYEIVEQIFDGNIPKLERTWEEFLKDDEIPDINKKRDAYWNQPAMKLWKEKLNEAYADFRKKVPHSYKTNDPREGLSYLDIDEFSISKEEFVQNAMDGAICTFAIVQNGNWFERGEMGWWAIVANEKDKKSWNREFNVLIDDLPDDTLLTVVDCHI